MLGPGCANCTFQRLRLPHGSGRCDSDTTWTTEHQARQFYFLCRMGEAAVLSPGFWVSEWRDEGGACSRLPTPREKAWLREPDWHRDKMHWEARGRDQPWEHSHSGWIKPCWILWLFLNHSSTFCVCVCVCVKMGVSLCSLGSLKFVDFLPQPQPPDCQITGVSHKSLWINQFLAISRVWTLYFSCDS